MSQLETAGSNRLAGFLEDPRKALWRLSLPILGGMGIHTLYSVADMIFVSWVGPDAVAAMAFNLPLVFFAFGVTMGLSSGVTAVLAQAVGGKNKSRADNIAEHALALGMILGISMAAVGLIWGAPMLHFLGAVGPINDLAWSYFQLVNFGLVFSVMSAFFRGILTGEGDTMRPMLLLSVGMILNLIFDPIFIFALDMGIRGAALATLMSQVIVLILFLYVFFHRKNTYVTLDWRNFRYSANIARAIFRIGLPASLAFIIMSAGAAIFNKILSTFSFHAVAAYQIANRFEMVAFMPIIALASGCVTLVGMFFGAGETDKLRNVINYTLRSAVLIGLTASAVVYPLAPHIIAMFRPSPEILEYGVSYLRVNALAFPIMPLGMISGRVMQGLGKGAPMLVITILRVLGFSAPLALYFRFVLDKPVIWVWYAMVISIYCAAAVGIIWLRYTLRHIGDRPAPPVEPAEPSAPEPEVGAPIVAN